MYISDMLTLLMLKHRTQHQMPRTITVRDPEHPANKMHTIGQETKAEARSLSNIELDLFLQDVITDEDDLKTVLELPRGKKLKLIKDVAMANYAREWSEAQEAKTKPQVKDDDADTPLDNQ